MINSMSNKQVRLVANLCGKAKVRREEGLYVVDGLRMCRELEPQDVYAMYVTGHFAGQPENKAWLKAYSYEIVTDVVMGVMSDTKTPQGILAVVRQKNHTLEQILRGGNAVSAGRTVEAGGTGNAGTSGGTGTGRRAIMVLETIQDPGNLGTIIRAGEGAGITGIIMNRETADIYSPKVIRSTMGSIFRMPFIYVDDLGGSIKTMKAAGVRFFAAHLDGTNNYDQEDYTDDVGFLIGNEARGLTDETAGLADCYVKIPMAGKVESLNAAVASSVLMFEMARQRRNKG